MKKVFKIFVSLSLPLTVFSQSTKVQTAFRNIQDYESSKDVSSLMKAKEAIDLASANAETKDKAKTWVYRARIYYGLFKNDLLVAEKKVPATVANKNERLTQAYGNVSVTNYEEAGTSMQKAVSIDKDAAQNYAMEMGSLTMQMISDVGNLAIGKYSVKNYKEAMGYFETSYETAKMLGKKDTNELTNALVCAQHTKDTTKIIEYNRKAIKDKVATAYNYLNLFDAQLDRKDTVAAATTMRNGREKFPNDADLMNRETDYLMSTGKTQEALGNLEKVIAANPKNAKAYFAKGLAYYGMANPLDASKKRYLDKPKNFDELMTQAETAYTKATEADPKLSQAWANLGNVYNVWGNEQMKRCDDLVKQATKLKECEEKSADMNKKGIAAYEKAIELDPNDKSSMSYLKRLYLVTNQPEKAEKIKALLSK